MRTNLVRRPVEGHVITASGRLIPQPPWIISGSALSAIAYDRWLVEQARTEAVEIADDWMVAKLVGVTAESIDAELRYLLSDFLFGHPDPVFEARRGAGNPTDE